MSTPASTTTTVGGPAGSCFVRGRSHLSTLIYLFVQSVLKGKYVILINVGRMRNMTTVVSCSDITSILYCFELCNSSPRGAVIQPDILEIHKFVKTSYQYDTMKLS